MIGSVIDTHVHPKMGAVALLAEMDRAGIARAVILAVDTDPADLARPDILRATRQSYFKTPQARWRFWAEVEAEMLGKLAPKVTNRVVAEMASAHPERFIPFGSVNLCKDAAYVQAGLDEIDRLGLQGIKLLPFAQFFDPAASENFLRVCAWSERTGRPVLIHTGCGAGPWDAPAFSLTSHPDRLRPALEKYPRAVVILAHLGAYSKDYPGIWFEEALQLGADFPNVWGDLAAVAWLLEDEGRTYRIRQTMGFEHILFASDYPAVASQVSIAWMVSLVQDSPFLSEPEKAGVLSGNARRLFGLPVFG